MNKDKRIIENCKKNGLILYLASTLDGFICRKNGGVDFLNKDPDKTYDYYEKLFLPNIDIILMGRKSYEQIINFPLKWPYPNQVSYVFTRDNIDKFKDKSTDNIKFVNEKIEDFLENHKNENKWLLGGNNFIYQFLEKELIDDLVIGIIPLIIGEGIKLCSNKVYDFPLKTISVQKYKKGIIQVHYKILKKQKK